MTEYHFEKILYRADRFYIYNPSGEYVDMVETREQAEAVVDAFNGKPNVLKEELNAQVEANATLQAENERLRARNAELEGELVDHKHDIEVHEEFQKNIRKSIQPYAIKFYDGNGANDGKTIYDHLGDYIGKLEKDALTITAFSLRDFHTGTLIDIPISGLIEHATRQNTRIKELEKKLEGKAKHWITPAELARVYEIVSKVAIESQYPKAVLNKLSEMVFFQTLPRPCLECNAIGEVGRPDHGLVCCDKCSGTGTTSLVCYEDDDSMTVYEYMFDDKQLDITTSEL